MKRAEASALNKQKSNLPSLFDSRKFFVIEIEFDALELEKKERIPFDWKIYDHLNAAQGEIIHGKIHKFISSRAMPTT